MTDAKERLLDAALAHVPFDGWSETAFDAAVAETGIAPALARGHWTKRPWVAIGRLPAISGNSNLERW